MKKNYPIVLLAICAVGFAAGIAWLFHLRFERGDVYPEYSSLRADPLGSMALYESLEKLPGLVVSRDFTTVNKLPEQDNTTYLHLAGDAEDWEWLPKDLVRDIEGFLTRGGRLVITFYPINAKPIISRRDRFVDESTPQKEDKESGDRDESKSDKPDEKKKMSGPDDVSKTNSVSLKKQWGVEFDFDYLKQSEENTYEPDIALNKTALPLPGMIEWHSSIIFTNLDPKWQTIYARDNSPVVIERRYGHGSIVMASDSWFVSNEALWKDRHPEFLAWLVGTNDNIVFDEAHLGIMETSGVAVLMRKYRLHGVIGGLILLAALFIWKNSVSLVPPYTDARQRGFVAGKDAASGFVNLLRRNVRTNEILKTCFTEWKKSCPQRSPHAADRIQRVQSVLDAEELRSWRDRDPVAAYRQICEILKHGRNSKLGTRNAEL